DRAAACRLRHRVRSRTSDVQGDCSGYRSPDVPGHDAASRPLTVRLDALRQPNHLSRMSMLVGYAAFVGVVRTVLLYLALVVAAVCAFDWPVRPRRINPFNRVARFFRGRIEPLMAPVERVIVRAGGLPSSAPWWALAAVVVGGILLISLLQL